MRPLDSAAFDSAHLRADLALIAGPFVGYLRERHCAIRTIASYRSILVRVAHSLHRAGRRLSTLGRDDVPGVVRSLHLRCLPPAQAVLHGWLKFRGRYQRPRPRTRWQSWIDDYVRFMERDRGLSPSAQSHYGRIAERYLAWQFRRGAVDWRRVRPQDIWQYAGQIRGPQRKPKGVSSELTALRQFLRFVHLRGACTPALAQAVPAVNERPRSLGRTTLSAAHRRRFLAAFDQKSAAGRRDYTMARCMTDLGLRCIEVVRLCLGDIDWERKSILVPPAKNGRGRKLPLPPQVATALRLYVRARPPTPSDRLFVGQRILRGRPLSPGAVRGAMERAYRRGGFPWHGTHLLRRGFATRLFARGANLKEIADLLGHRLVTTTERYAQVDRDGLDALVRPWPL